MLGNLQARSGTAQATRPSFAKVDIRHFGSATSRLGVMSDAVLSVAAEPPSGRSGRGFVTLQTAFSGLCDLP